MNKKRIDTDVVQLIESDHEVTLLNGLTEFCVKVPGPKETPYEGGVWRVRVYLPDSYPFKSPSVSFMDPIIHPNVDENSGAVCLDVLNQTWSPLFSLVNVFDSFLPQLLAYPNPDHPMNREAATTAIKEPEKFERLVREHSAQLAKAASKTKPPRKKCLRRRKTKISSASKKPSGKSIKSKLHEINENSESTLSSSSESSSFSD